MCHVGLWFHSKSVMESGFTRRADTWVPPLHFVDEFMFWFCESICWFPARCARPECAFGPTWVWKKKIMLLMQIIVNGVRESIGSCLFCLRSTCDPPGSLNEVTGGLREALRSRLKNEGQVCRGLENLAETNGFYGADFRSGSGTSAEPVVFAHAREANNASSFRSA